MTDADAQPAGAAEGEMTFQLGDRRVMVRTGSFVVVPLGGTHEPSRRTPPARRVAYPVCEAVTGEGTCCLRDGAYRNVLAGQEALLCGHHARLVRSGAVMLAMPEPTPGGVKAHDGGEPQQEGTARPVCEALTATGERCRGRVNYAVDLDDARPRWLRGHHAAKARRERGSVELVPIDPHECDLDRADDRAAP